jgi:Predicted membrane protein (DUF2339)
MLSTIPMGPLMWLLVVPVFGLTYESGPLRDLGWLAWPAIVVVSYLLMYWFERAWPLAVVESWHVGTAWVVMFLVTWAIATAVRDAVPDSLTWSSTVWCVVPAMFVLAMRPIGPSLEWPVKRFPDLYRGLIPLAPAAGMLVWVLWACSQPGAPDPLPYVPVVNPLELVQALGLIVAYVSLVGYAAPSDMDSFRRGGIGVIAALAFVAINVLVARVVHFYWGVRFDVDDLLESPVFQAGISILWGVTAGVLMTLARMRINRAVWMMGAGVLAALIVKLFLIDLGNVGGVARIVSFLATGVLILAIGYFAPVPPKAERAA